MHRAGARGSRLARRSSSLVRTSDFIYSSLYDPEHGYFAKTDVIASPAAAIRFDTLLGKGEYDTAIARVYAASPAGWSTPAELFQPVYSQGLARYLLAWLAHTRATGDPRQSLTVYELGGGAGSNARHVCDFLKATAPGVYRGLQYTVVEISQRLSEVQSRALAGHPCARSVVLDAMSLGDVADAMRRGEVGVGSLGGGPPLPHPSPCVVLGLEVLDNLPHDKVVALVDGHGGVALHEAHVARVDGVGLDPRAPRFPPHGPRPELEEVYYPLTPGGECDTILSIGGVDRASGRLLHEEGGGGGGGGRGGPAAFDWSWRGRMARRWAGLAGGAAPMPPPPANLVWARYLPTGAWRLLRSLGRALPRHSLVLADFTHLPPPAVSLRTVNSDSAVRVYAPGAGAPLVASKDAGSRRTVDHATYLSPPLGTADVFFPTDFTLLAKLVQARSVERGVGVGGQRVRDAAAAAAAAAVSSSGHASSASRPPFSGVKLQSQAAFLSRYAECARTRTITGYNPMLEDYLNTAVLTTGGTGT